MMSNKNYKKFWTCVWTADNVAFSLADCKVIRCEQTSSRELQPHVSQRRASLQEREDLEALVNNGGSF